jgi:hypothetical protein
MRTTTLLALSAALIALAPSASFAMPNHRHAAPAQLRGAFALVPPAASTRVYSGGQYRGQDPDANIRAALLRESGRSGN